MGTTNDFSDLDHMSPSVPHGVSLTITSNANNSLQGAVTSVESNAVIGSDAPDIEALYPAYGWAGYSTDSSFTTKWPPCDDPTIFGTAFVANVSSSTPHDGKHKRGSFRIPMELWEPIVTWLSALTWSHFGLGPCVDGSHRE